ncbi:hypothetical protein DERP_010467 [Dermatophagoides pteronyssinus]|uniref:Uncharacterized protein n=1 Tax=Dermatophagoides pteronyssinus TaxID=6956 RepID=A0ABQ8J4Y9_DERPT|nr:hypothetical protein DERP_010467 [Dermatophagoides pteronyssinus]
MSMTYSFFSSKLTKGITFSHFKRKNLKFRHHHHYLQKCFNITQISSESTETIV